MLCTAFIACIAGEAMATGPVIPDPTGANLPAEMANIMMEEMLVRYKQGQPWLRTAHGKQHGCLRALLHVPDDLPADLKVGLFANGTGDSPYPVFMRYSNGAGPSFGPGKVNVSDMDLDGRGLSLKIFGNMTQFGPTYLPSNNFMDFTFALAPTFFVSDVNSTLEMFQALQSGLPAMKLFFSRYPWLGYVFNVATRRVISDALQENWHTPPPRMHGPSPAKYRLSPCTGPQTSPASECQTFNCIRDSLQRRLATGTGCYNWQIQRFESDETTPIEDLTIKWNTSYVTIGQVEVLSTTKAWGPGQEAACRQMSFNDWRVTADHQPLGFVEEFRRVLYHQQALMRWQFNGQPLTPVAMNVWEDYPNL